MHPGSPALCAVKEAFRGLPPSTALVLALCVACCAHLQPQLMLGLPLQAFPRPTNLQPNITALCQTVEGCFEACAQPSFLSMLCLHSLPLHPCFISPRKPPSPAAPASPVHSMQLVAFPGFLMLMHRACITLSACSCDATLNGSCPAAAW